MKYLLNSVFNFLSKYLHISITLICFGEIKKTAVIPLLFFPSLDIWSKETVGNF